MKKGAYDNLKNMKHMFCTGVCIAMVVTLFLSASNAYSFHASATGGDLAERMPLSQAAVDDEELKPSAGEVVVVNEGGFVQRSTEAYSPYVVGIVSTKPAHTLRNMIEESVPIALSGIVPCKVTNENGFVKTGDLLVSSSKPGFAMKALSNAKPGTIVGKAIDKQDTEEDNVLALVMLR